MEIFEKALVGVKKRCKYSNVNDFCFHYSSAYLADSFGNMASSTTLILTILKANNITCSTNITTKNHYCVIWLGQEKCRTPVKAKCWPT